MKKKKLIWIVVFLLLGVVVFWIIWKLPRILGITDYSLHYPEESIRCSARFGSVVEPSLIQAVIDKESGGVLNAKSFRGSLGLMQLQFKTARSHQDNPELQGIGPRPITRQALLSEPETNICFGTSVLAGYFAVFKGNVKAALAAYNAGKSAGRRVERGRKNGYAEDVFSRWQVYSQKYGPFLENR